MSVAKQAKTAFLHGPAMWKLPIVGIEPATFRSKSAAHTTYTTGPHMIHMKLIFLSELFSLQPSVMITFLYEFVRKCSKLAVFFF